MINTKFLKSRDRYGNFIYSHGLLQVGRIDKNYIIRFRLLFGGRLIPIYKSSRKPFIISLYLLSVIFTIPAVIASILLFITYFFTLCFVYTLFPFFNMIDNFDKDSSDFIPSILSFIFCLFMFSVGLYQSVKYLFFLTWIV